MITKTVTAAPTADNQAPAVTIVYPSANALLSNNPFIFNPVSSMDLVVLLDLSLSMDASTGSGTTRLSDARTALLSFIDQVDPNIRIAIASFSTPELTRIEQTFTTDKTALKNKISGFVTTGGQTATGTAISFAVQYVNANLASTNKRIMMVTDGRPTEADTVVQAATDTAVQSFVVVDPVIFNPSLVGTDLILMQDMAAKTGGIMTRANDLNELNAYFTQFAQKLASVLIDTSTLAAVRGTVTDNFKITSIRYRYKEDAAGGYSGPFTLPITPAANINYNIQVSGFTLADGQYTFEVIAADERGNEDTKTIVFTLDSTRPTTSSTTYDDSGSIRLSGLADATMSPRGRVSKVRKVEISLDGGSTFDTASLSGDGVDNDKDGVVDEEYQDSVNQNDDWSAVFPQASARGDFWADDPAGKAGVFEPGVDEVFLMIPSDSLPAVRYTGANQVVSQGKTAGVQTPVGAELFPLIDEDMGKAGLTDSQARWIYYVNPGSNVTSLAVKLRVIDEAGNAHDTVFTIAISPRLTVSVSNLAPAGVPAPSDTIAVFGLDLWDPTAGGRSTGARRSSRPTPTGGT